MLHPLIDNKKKKFCSLDGATSLLTYSTFLYLFLPEYEVLNPGALQLDLPALHEHPRDVRRVVKVRALLPLAVPPLGQRVPGLCYSVLS